METDTDEFEVGIYHDDENHYMRIVVSNAEGQYMLARGSWGSAVDGFPVPAVAAVPCEIWNEIVDLVAANALLDAADNLTNDANAMLGVVLEED